MRDEFTAKGGTRFVQDSQFPDDVEVCPRGDWNDWSESVTIPLADLLEFNRHVESLKRKGDTVYNGESEFRLVGQSSTMSPGEGVIGTATCELPCGEVFDPALPTTIGEMPIRFTDLKGRIGPGAMTRLVCFSYASAWK
jgi:hypothetical protein